jgi:hypothetical protein
MQHKTPESYRGDWISARLCPALPSVAESQKQQHQIEVATVARKEGLRFHPVPAKANQRHSQPRPCREFCSSKRSLFLASPFSARISHVQQ